MSYSPGHPNPFQGFAQPRDFSFSEVVSAIPAELAEKVAEAQVAHAEANDIPHEPWPLSLTEDQPEAEDVLANNTALYDDDIEDILDEDLVLQALYRTREAHPDSEIHAMALRARRTVAVRLILEQLRDLPPQESQSAA